MAIEKMTEADFHQLLNDFESEPTNEALRDRLYKNGSQWILWDGPLAGQWALFFSSKRSSVGRRPTPQAFVATIRNNLDPKAIGLAREKIESTETDSDSEVAAPPASPRTALTPHQHETLFLNSFTTSTLPPKVVISEEVALCNDYMEGLLDNVTISILSEYLTDMMRDGKKIVVPRGENVFRLLDSVRAYDSRYKVLRDKYYAMKNIRDQLSDSNNNHAEPGPSLVALIKQQKKEVFAAHRTSIFHRGVAALLTAIIVPCLLLTKWFTGYWFGDLFTTRGEQTCDKLLAILEKPAAAPRSQARLCI
jgi:hypothetical protein